MANVDLDNEFKTSMYENLARIGKAISCGNRLRLLDLISQGPRTVEALANEIGQTIGNTSQHLQVLRRVRLVNRQRQGTFVTYSLGDPLISDFLCGLRMVGEDRLFEMKDIADQFLKDRSYFEPIEINELRRLMVADDVTVIDVRPSQEYSAGHLAGAISVPLDDIESRLSEIPTDSKVVAYCRGPYCLMAIDAVALLSKKNIRAYRADIGVADFRALKFEIVSEGATL
jgi:rhodanese-related sulfurtransferase/DNA-binding transcriptional ArsR family regulator